MENKCWFCGNNEAENNLEYEVLMRKHDNRKDKTMVEVPRCRQCADKHKKADTLSFIMYLMQLPVFAVLLYVFKVEFIYLAIIWLLLTRVLSTFSLSIRNKVAEPDKSVCVVSENPDVKAKMEEGYIETRRF